MALDVIAKRRATSGLIAVPAASNRPHRSDAVQFEVHLKEALAIAGAGEGVPGPNAKRLACHVAVLRSILVSGALGPLQHVLETICSELLRSTYSDALTTSPLGEASGTYAGIEGVPFFEQLQHSQQEAAALSSQLEVQRHVVSESLNYLKERTEQEVPSRDEEEMAHKLAELEREVNALRGEREENAHKVESAEKDKVEALRAMEAEVRRWKQDAHDARRETRQLKKKAKEQEAVRLAFAELRQPSLMAQDLGVLGGSSVASMAKQLKEENELAEAVAMESQLILLQNARIDEYEAALESTPPSEQSQLRADFAQELQAMQEEMVKLLTHIRSFEDRLPLSTVAERPLAAATPAPAVQAAGAAKQVELQVSFDGGVTFSPLRPPPSVKTLSNRATEFQAAFSLPRDATHVRLWSSGGMSPEQPTPASSPAPKPGTFPRGTSKNENRPPEDRGTTTSAGGAVEMDSTGAEHAGPSADDPLWDGYFARVASWGGAAATLAPTTAVRSKLPRTSRKREVDLQTLRHTIEAVFRAKVKTEGSLEDGWDGDVAEGHNSVSIAGTRTSLHVFFYKWLEDKYGVRATVLLVAHGLLTAVERFREASAVVRLFGQVLSGRLDDATWRYTMQWRRVASATSLESSDAFKDFLGTLYPGMKDDELASLASEYVACTVHPSRSAAIDFLTAKLLAKNEPRVKKWNKILRWKDTAHKNGFRRLEFLEIVGKLFPMLSTDEAGAQFDAAVHVSGGDRVAVDTLALITSCLDASLVSTTEGLQAKKHPSLVPVRVASSPSPQPSLPE